MSAIHQKEAGRLLAMLVGKDMHLADCAVQMQQLFEAAELDAIKEGMRRAANVNVGFTLPTGYTGTRQVLGIHFTSGHAHGVADTRLTIRHAAEQLTEKDL